MYIYILFVVVYHTYLGHLLPVGLGVKGGLCQEGGVLLGGHAQLVVEGVMPNLTNQRRRRKRNNQ